ncbi:palmitoyltransferase pfa5 [Myotisia sp. PD_48]|nr:palmitoyltransferase pfa5 [Myotisia sp. PD_48]
MACDPKASHLAASRIIPVILSGLVGYGSYAFTKPFCIDYLIDPPRKLATLRPRKGVGIGLLIGFYLLLLLMVIVYVRLISTVFLTPGYIPRGPQWSNASNNGANGSHEEDRRSGSKHERPTRFLEKGECLPHPSIPTTSNNVEKEPYPFNADGLEAFYMKDVFVCKEDGRPPWCSKCCQYKSDRAHHCSEVDRCVRKMDHFCPWVGGVISESSFKFFIQFLFYGLLFTIFNVVVMSRFVAELRLQFGTINVHWLLVLVVSGFFGLFLFGMLLSSLQLALINSSTIESLDRRTKVWTLAVLISRPNDLYRRYQGRNLPFPIVSYPSSTHAGSSNHGESSQAPQRREFAILTTKPGENPFELGSPLSNLKEVMGYNLLDWFIPLRHSPCASHENQESAFRLGPTVQRLRREAGLLEPSTSRPKNRYSTPAHPPVSRRKRKKNKSRDFIPASRLGSGTSPAHRISKNKHKKSNDSKHTRRLEHRAETRRSPP